MKTLKDIILEATSEVNPLPRRTKNFVDKHTVQKINDPVAPEDQFTAPKIKKDTSKGASYKHGEDTAVYEETDDEKTKKETMKTFPNVKHFTKSGHPDWEKHGIKNIPTVKEATKHAGKISAVANNDEREYGDKAGRISAALDKSPKKKVSLPKAPWDKVEEETMSDAETAKRENIVKSMKKNTQGFKDRYGDRWKSVMYATATKNAMKEALDPVGKEDADVDNDGKKNTKSDQYLKNRRKAIAAKIKEDVEQIDELSFNTLHSYVKKSIPDRNTKLSDKRMSGVNHANAKMAQKKYDEWKAKKATEEVESVDLDEAFKVGAMKLKDGSSVSLTKESAEALNGLFNQLNSSNKSKMEERLMSGSNGFDEILAFAKEV